MQLFVKVFTILCFFSFLNLNAQNNPEAEALLSSVAETYKKHAGFEGVFTMKIENKEADISEKQNGTFAVAGNKYKISTPLVDRITDGETVWTVFKEDEEVQETYFDEEEEEFTPSSIFTLYEKNLTYPTIKDTLVFDVEKAKAIDMFPNSSDETYDKIKLIIQSTNDGTNYISMGIVYSKNGTIVTYHLKETNAVEAVTKFDRFKFRAEDYPNLDLDIIDLK